MTDPVRDEVRIFYRAQLDKGKKPEVSAIETVIFYMDQYRYDRNRASSRLDAAEMTIVELSLRLKTLEGRQ